MSARSSGAVGNDPLTYRAFYAWSNGAKDAVGDTIYPYGDRSAEGCQTILDFGCGPKQIHTKKLRGLGYGAIGFDLVQDPDVSQDHWFILGSGLKFDCIIASNVLNIQPGLKHMDALFAIWKSLLTPKGLLIANYPESPRYAQATNSDVWFSAAKSDLTSYSGKHGKSARKGQVYFFVQTE